MFEHRILFVCHGNICRSPMAEVVFRDMVAKRGLQDSFVVSSRATSTEEIWNGVGNPVYPPARAELARHGLRGEGIRARLLRAIPAIPAPSRLVFSPAAASHSA